MKKWLIAAGILLFTGLIAGTAGMILLDFDFTKLSTETYTTTTTEITGKFTAISVDADTADIRFIRSEDGICRAVIRESEKETHTVSVRENTLIIETRETPWWKDFTLLSFVSPEIVLYLPDEAYDTLRIESDTGDTEIPTGFRFNRAEIETDTGDILWCAPVTESLVFSTDTGDITAQKISVERLQLEMDTGDALLTNILCRQFTAESSTGDIRLERFDADSIRIETSTGDVTGTLLSEKIFVTETDTGDVRVPKGSSGGRCEIRTDTGDIELTIAS